MAGFQLATKKASRARLALLGPAGSGKTFTALTFAHALGKRVAFIDTERGSAAKYSGDFAPFDVLELDSYSVENYTNAIAAADEAAYDVLIIDSLSHAWAGKGGLLEFVDNEGRRNAGGNKFAAWREATPMHNLLIDTMLGCNMHLLVTMRTKMEHVQEKDERGRTVIRKVGMQPIQRDGLEYEFDLVCDMDTDHVMVISKSRVKALDGTVIKKPGADFAAEYLAWLTEGEAMPEPDPLEVQRTRYTRLRKARGWGADVLPEAAKSAGVDLSTVTAAQMFDLLDSLEAPPADNATPEPTPEPTTHPTPEPEPPGNDDELNF